MIASCWSKKLHFAKVEGSVVDEDFCEISAWDSVTGKSFSESESNAAKIDASSWDTLWDAANPLLSKVSKERKFVSDAAASCE
jgi:hypothetical protein